MRIFISNVDSYVGKALCSDLRNVLDQENRLIGTLTNDAAEVDSNLLQALGVKRVVSRSSSQKYLADLLSCSLIVFDLHSSNIEDVEQVIKHLKVAELQHETTFVLISSVNVWAKTRKQYVPLRGDDEDDVADDDADAAKEVKKRPKELTDQDIDRRVPSEAYEAWKYLETLTLSLGCREKLRPHVVAAGVLYGNGETTFNELFKAAWLTQPIHKIIAPGDNYIPCVHVRDVARLVRVMITEENIGSYLIAVDQSRLTQGIVNQISHKRDVPICAREEVDSEFKEVLSLDLILEPSAPLQAPNFDWWCRDGLVQNIEKVAAEFCKWRNLRPIKMVVIGPPGSKAERFSAKVAEHYLHEDPPHLTYDQIVSDACRGNKPSQRKLRRKVEKLATKPGAKLPLELRTKLVRDRLLTNICRYRGYVLEGYPTSYAEAEALFMEKIPDPDEEEPQAPEEEEDVGDDFEIEEEDEEEQPPPPPEEDEDEGDSKPRTRVAEAVSTVPEFCVVLKSSMEICKARIFSGEARGAQNEEDFRLKTAEFNASNLAEDGSPSTSEFFSEICNMHVLSIDVDTCNEEAAFQAIRIYMERNGQFFNYLRSEEEVARQQEAELAQREKEEHLQLQQIHEERARAEEELRSQQANEEARRRKVISQNEATQLESEAQPLRQYLLETVVPTLAAGLQEVCRDQPEDPIEFLAQYLFAHAQDVKIHLPAVGE